MTFILFVGHGSREEPGNEEIRIFANNLVKKKNLVNTEVCFLEFGTPDISTGIERCAQRGAREIAVIPVILLSAGHSKIHIPQSLDEARKTYPEIRFHYGTPVGTDIRILDILEDRLKPVYDPSRTPANKTAILIVGRGSSDPDANSQLFRISRLFWERCKFQMVETAFMGITEPLMQDGLDRCRKLGAETIIVLPYFLFTGILMDRMKKMVDEFASHNPGLVVKIADYFGFHPYLEDIVEKRIKEALSGEANLNCDLCHFRHGALHHNDHDGGHHGHHHHGHHHH